MHTNLDIAEDGLNDNLCKILGIENTKVLECAKEIGLGRVGYIEPIKAEVFAKKVKGNLNANGLVCYGNMGKEIKKVGVCGGAGSSLFDDALRKDCDLMITGDVSYHMGMDYANRGLTIIDPGHFASENHVIYKIEKLVSKMTDVEINTYSKEDTFRTFI